MSKSEQATTPKVGDQSTTAPPVPTKEVGKDGGRGRREKSRDIVGTLDERLVKIEATMSEWRDTIEDMDQRVQKLESRRGEGELREEMQGALNILADNTSMGNDALKSLLVRTIEKVDRLEMELNLCKVALTSGGGVQVSTMHKVDAPKPKAYGGARNAREIDNFLWSLERYFEAVGILDEFAKMRSVSLYLEDVATVWWRRKCEDVKRGMCTIDTWEDFTKELKAQFYPKDAEKEARTKLRRLQHRDGYVREYVREFSELMLEIPDIGEKEALYNFLDGLSRWAKQELERRDVKNLATAMATAESLIEFKRRDSRSKGNEDEYEGNSGGDEGASSEDDKEHSRPKYNGRSKWAKDGKAESSKPWRKEEKGESSKPKLACFICDGPHRAYECPKRGKLAALIKE